MSDPASDFTHPFALAVLRYADETEGALSAHGYRKWRKQHHDRNIPSIAWAAPDRSGRYWSQWIEYLGLGHRAAATLTYMQRTYTADELRDRMIQITRRHDMDTITSHRWDALRATDPDAQPSSSVYRKIFGSWDSALGFAGLDPTGFARPTRGAADPARVATLLLALQRHCLSDMTPADYDRVAAWMPFEHTWPSAEHIVSIFGSWDEAMHAAGARPGGELHPAELWTRDEVRRVIHHARLMVGRATRGYPPLTESAYAAVRAASKVPLPTWRCLRDLCPARLAV